MGNTTNKEILLRLEQRIERIDHCLYGNDREGIEARMVRTEAHLETAAGDIAELTNGLASLTTSVSALSKAIEVHADSEGLHSIKGLIMRMSVRDLGICLLFAICGAGSMVIVGLKVF